MKLICRINTIPIKTSRLKKNIFLIAGQFLSKPSITKTILKKKNVVGLTLPNFKTDYKVSGIKTVS